MTYTTNDQFAATFKYTVKTDSYKFNDKELSSITEQAYVLYAQPGLNFDKTLISAGNFENAMVAIIEMSKQGYTPAEGRRPLHSGPNYAFYMLKPRSLQNEDKEAIKKLVMDNYLSTVEHNEKAYKAKLKQDLINAERQKEAEKAAKAQADKEAKLQAQAEKQFEELLQEEGI